MTITNLLPRVSAIAGTALMAALLAVLLARYFAEALFPEGRVCAALSRWKPAPVDNKATWSQAFLWAAVWFFGTRLFLFAATGVFALVTDRAEFFFANYLGYWDKWDAPHYIGLVRNWYVNEGDPRFHIVFFPVYPLVSRVLMPLFGGNAEASALFVSNACGLALGAMLYRLTELESGSEGARRAVRYLYCSPLSFFLSIAYTESTFMLLTVGAVYLARRRRFAWALVVGAVCSAARLMGVVVAIPIFWEMLAHDREKGPVRVGRVATRAASCCAVLAGAAAYLLLNYVVTGNPFQFWIYQRDHWYNTSGTLWNTFSYVTRYAISFDRPMRLFTWIPTLGCLFGVLTLIAWRARRARVGDAAYAWAYMYMTIVPTWLISGPRYVFGLYALYPMLAGAMKRRWMDIALTMAFLVGLAVMSCAFIFTAGVY